jgi:hypothetical protein
MVYGRVDVFFSTRTLLPIRIEPIKPSPTLDVITWVDLFGLAEKQARLQVLRAVEFEVLSAWHKLGFQAHQIESYFFPAPNPDYGKRAAPYSRIDLDGVLKSATESMKGRVARASSLRYCTLESVATAHEDPAIMPLIRRLLAAQARSDRFGMEKWVAAVLLLAAAVKRTSHLSQSYRFIRSKPRRMQSGERRSAWRGSVRRAACCGNPPRREPQKRSSSLCRSEGCHTDPRRLTRCVDRGRRLPRRETRGQQI